MMSEKKILSVDLAQEDPYKEILPRSPQISSYHAHWEGLRFDIHQQPGHETPEHILQQHAICVSLEPTINKAERLFNGNFQAEDIANGDVVIVPAHINHISRWRSPAEFIVIGLEPAFLKRVAIETGDWQEFDIKPRFAAPEPLIHHIGLALKSELEANCSSSRVYIESLTNTLCVHLLKYYCVASTNNLYYSKDKGLSNWKLKQAIAYINDNLEQDLTLAEIAAVVDMSMYHFSRLFKQSTGFAPHQYVMNCRIERAKKLLIQTNQSIEKICEQIGFQSQSHFTNVFRKIMGITPRAYREQAKI